MDEAGLIHSALGHQKMEVREKIDPVSECLNGRDDSGPKPAPGYNLEISG
jgi:hypothetical protein